MDLVKRKKLRARWMTSFVVFILIAIGYSSSLKFDFINYDDPEYITDNPRINTGVSVENTKWALTSAGKMNLWHPLTYLSHQLDVTLFGLKPMGHHAMNVLLHSVGGVFLYLLIANLTKSKWLPLVIVAIWAFHPQRVQSVAWLSERKDVLSGMFFFLTLYSYTKWMSSRAEWLYWLSLASCSLALLSKPSVVSLPFILIGIYFFFSERKLNWRKMLPRILPFLTLAALTALMTMYFQSKGGLANLNSGIGSSAYFAKILLSFSFYIERFFNPTPHQLWFYPDLSVKRLLLAGAITVISVLLVVLTYRKSKLVGFGALWYLMMWLPISGIIPLSFYFRADRYSYLPQIGIIIVLVGLVMIAVKKWQLANRLAMPVAILVIASFTVIQQFHLPLWKDNQTLFKHEISVNPRSLLAPIHYGSSIEKEQPLVALEYYTKAHKIDKESALALTNMGVIYERQGMRDKAIDCYRMATLAAVQDHDCWVRYIDILTREKKAEGVENSIEEAIARYPSSEDILLVAARYQYVVKKDATKALVYYRKLYTMGLREVAFIRDYAIIAYETGHKKEAKELFSSLPLVDRNHPAIKAILSE